MQLKSFLAICCSILLQTDASGKNPFPFSVTAFVIQKLLPKIRLMAI